MDRTSLEAIRRLAKRQCNELYEDCSVPFWYSTTGLIIRYAIVGGIFVLVLLILLGSYIHAQRRAKKGLPPLRYHRWLLRNNPNYYPNQSRVYYNAGAGDVPAQGYAMQQQYAPPAYNNFDAPPLYRPPEGATKMLADQHIQSMDEQGQPRTGESSQVQEPAQAHPGQGMGGYRF